MNDEQLADLLTQLRSALRYEPETGHFYRGSRRAGYRKSALGYRYISRGRHYILEHRLAIAFASGQWPPDVVDHINMVRDDNRLCNLRLSSRSENQCNRPKQSNNTSGFKGVSHHKGTAKYDAAINFNKQKRYLGHFSTAEEAAEAYKRAAIELHGSFVWDSEIPCSNLDSK